MKIRMVKDFHKAWSTWSGAALVGFMAAREAMPVVQERIPETVYDWTVWALAIATPILRAIDQGLTRE